MNLKRQQRFEELKVLSEVLHFFFFLTVKPLFHAFRGGVQALSLHKMNLIASCVTG